MIWLYASILLISIVLVFWKTRTTESESQHAISMGPAESSGLNGRKSESENRGKLKTREGLTLKVMPKDRPAVIPARAVGSRKRDRSAELQPAQATESKTEEIAAPVPADETATQASEALVQKAAEFEQSAASPIENSSSQFSTTLSEPAAELEENAAPVMGDGSAANVGESPLLKPSEAEEVAPSVPADGNAIQASEPPIQETAAVEESPVSLVGEHSSVQPEIQESSAIEEISSAVVGDNVADTSEAPIQEAAAVEENPALFAAEDSSVQPEVQEPVAKTLLCFYGLCEQPFGVTPDPVYFYLSRAHREALTSLSRGVQNLRGFIALIAEPGMGKTTLLNKLMEELRDSARIVFLFQTQCNSRELLRYLLSELGVQHAGMDVVAMHRALNDFLFQEMLEGRRFVLVVDEAQNLQDSVLETLRLLSDFETTHAKLLQIVLAGQPQLANKLTRPNLSQLRQRIAVLANLEALDAAETARYIEHRLRVAGSSEGIFTAEAVALIAERSEGIPRNINNICFNALLLGYSQGRKTIDAGVVQQVVGKLNLESFSPRLEPQKAAEKAAPAAVAKDSQLPEPAGENQPGSGPVPEAPVKVRGTLTGKLTELIRSRPWSKDEEYRLQVLLEREPSSEIHVAERYYSCSFYVSAEQAAAFRIRQPIRIRFEQD